MSGLFRSARIENGIYEAEADALLERHHHYAASVALFQISIALGAIAALTRVWLVWAGSLVAGLVGIVVMVLPLLAS